MGKKKNGSGNWAGNKIDCIDALEGLRQMPDYCIQTCVTSPPYWNQRDYGVKGQYGREETPEAYVSQLVAVFKEVHRVLRPDGTLWLNLGDAYWGSGKAGKNKHYQKRHKEFGKHSPHQERFGIPTTGRHPYLKAKDLIGLPWLVAFALQRAGWYLRQDIIWHKPNPMPESVVDRCTKAHEYLFLFSKSSRYYFDNEAIKQPLKHSSIQSLQQDMKAQTGSDRVPGKTNGAMKAVGAIIGGYKHKKQPDASTHFATRNANNTPWKNTTGKCNKRSVWSVPTKPSKEAHFACFPPRINYGLYPGGK